MNRADDIDLADDGASRVDELVVSWERRDELGLSRAAFRTAREVLECEEDVQKRMATEEGVGSALLFLSLVVLVGFTLWCVIPVAVLAILGGRVSLGAISVLGYLALSSPLLGFGVCGSIGLVLHASARFFGAKTGTLGAMVRVVCYAMGGSVFWLTVLPCACMLFTLSPFIVLYAVLMLIWTLAGEGGRPFGEDFLFTAVYAGVWVGGPVGFLTGLGMFCSFVEGCRRGLKVVYGASGKAAGGILGFAVVMWLALIAGLGIGVATVVSVWFGN